MNNIFNIENFDVLSDNDNYYFFRGLNNGDNSDLDNNITRDINGNILRVRTDRERYEDIPKYNEESILSLEEVVDHVKMHHRTDTNCISLTSNANVSLLYGREYYKDKYVMVSVPKNELGSVVINAGEYMINEVNKRIDLLLQNNSLSEEVKYYLDKIDNAKSKEELEFITEQLKTNEEDITDKYFEKGIEYSSKDVNTVDYQALNKEQNLEKDKMVAKLNVIGVNILPRSSNKFLIQTIGNAFSSLEFLHYKDIEHHKLIELPKEIVDIFAMLQQMPSNYPMLNELKRDLLKIASNGNFKTEEFNYNDLSLNTENAYTIENMYNLTNGDVDYDSAIKMYKKSFYLAKSKLRTISMISNLDNILGGIPEYADILRYLRSNTYGVEPKIFSKTNSNKLKVSESVNLDFSNKELELFNFINNLDTSDLNYIVNRPLNAMSFYLNNFKSIEKRYMSREEYYANAIIDLFDWSKIGVVKFNPKRRNDLVNKLIEKDVVSLYNKLKEMNVKEEKISNTLLTIIIKDVDLKNVDLTDTFSAEELDDFMGYYRIKGTPKLKLRSYQADTFININKNFKHHQFTAAILPTGAGKSFVALAEMLEYKDKEILYLAPNDVILSQIEDYIVEYLIGDTNTKNRSELIKEVFPNLKLATYQSLESYKEQYVDFHETKDKKWDLIIFDELHRSGAPEWKNHVLELLKNQSKETKVLGITATPERDVDGFDMADEWAEYFGYTDEEITAHKHLAINMDLEEAIRLGYVINPKIASCEYSLQNDEGFFENLNARINTTNELDKKNELIKRLDYFRKRFSEADGISKVIGDNVKLGGRYIVFCPIVNNNGEVVEDEDGLLNDYRITGEEVINKYINELKRYLKEYYQVSDEEIDSMLEFHSMLGKYGTTKNEKELKNFENKNPNKIKFMIVMNKLNEGSHAKNDGLIWFRPLDENSKILFLQQFGRIIYSVNPNKELKDDDRPVAIDIPCNNVRVKLKKKEKQSDLDKLKVINGWIISRDGKIPDLNSYDRVESSYGSSLKRIQEKYTKYLDDSSLLDKMVRKNYIETSEILRIGNEINLWDYSFPEKIKTNSKNNYDYNEERDIFSVSALLKDFYEFEEEVDRVCKILSPEERVFEYIEFVNAGYKPKVKDSNKKFSDGTPVNYFWEKYENKVKILKELNTNSKYKNGYELAKNTVNMYIEKSNKRKGNLSLSDKIAEYIEKVNNGYNPISFDPNEYFSNGRVVNYFLSAAGNKEKIIKELNTNPKYEVGYELAKNVLNSYFIKTETRKENKIVTSLTTEERISEYIGMLNQGYKPISKELNKCFSDGSLIKRFWGINNNKEKIIKELNENPKYQSGYEMARKIINDSNIDENMIKVGEYIEMLNNGYIPKANDLEKYFSDGKPVRQFWHNKEKIIKELTTNPKYQYGYEKAKNTISEYLQENEKRKENRIVSELSQVEKIAEYIEKLNNGYIPKANASNIYFSDGSPINTFWSVHKEKIIKELKENPKYQSGYDVAKSILNSYLQELIFHNVNRIIINLNSKEKLEEYIKKLNNGYIPKNKELKEKWSDGTPVNYFWSDNKEKIIKELIENPKYQVGYETAKNVINDKGIEKISEYIEKLNNGYIPKSKDSKEKWSDGTPVNYFWSDNKEKIIKELTENLKYQVGYETTKRTINTYLEEYMKREENKIVSELSTKEKIAEYIEKLNNGYIIKYKDFVEKWSDGTRVNYFWENKEKIIKELETNPKYDVGYEKAKNTINEYLEESKNKENKKLVKELCVNNGVDVEKNKSILNKSYNEVYAKICYLNDNNISIVKDGELHEIFFMSDINMQAKYNVSLDSLINQYINENSRGRK